MQYYEKIHSGIQRICLKRQYDGSCHRYAFTGIVNSLVNDIINPILGIFTGKIDFSNLFLTLDGSHYETLAAAEKAGAAVFKYGSFISNVINFIIMALVVFCIVKFLNKNRQLRPQKNVRTVCLRSVSKQPAVRTVLPLSLMWTQKNYHKYCHKLCICPAKWLCTDTGFL